ncbi:S9 family peptidase [Sphingomonas sp. JC676]|uniref:S9 family peptidase n=1 Tax=Sphingomonas sp. JC676 TaxID=2768065 RepID=UPI0016579E5B|nr:S9 family peptidase [Sphingomonas sp. JC676]MBC9033643.1 S9 family peptidase [Sphingomonas sp. JC676]
MTRLLAATAVALVLALPVTAQVKTPDRPATDPKSVTSPVNPDARAVPIEDIGASRSLGSSAWSVDGKQIFVATNLTGRTNIWRTDAAGSWPVQLTQSEDTQSGLAASADGKYVYFQQDVGGNEYTDIYRVPVNGGAVENLTNTPDRRENGMLVGPSGGLVALSTKLKSEGQANIAVMDANGQVRVLTKEADPQYSWTAVAWIDGGKALIADRDRVDSKVGEVWRIDVATGAATKLIGKADTVYDAVDITPDGKWLAVNTDEGTGQSHAGLYEIATKQWKWLKPTPWEQMASNFTRDGKTLIFGTNADTRSTLYKYDLATGAETALSIPPGVNYLTGNDPRSPDGRTLLVNHSGADSPTNLYLYDLATGAARPATQLAIASLTPAALPKSDVVTYKSFDGTLISAIVTMPANLKRDGSNPAIVLPHGGPTGQAQDGYSRYATAFASRGYVVIQPNFRGSTGYGRAFQDANFKDLGGGDLKDTVAAKAFLVATGYVDPKRVGIFGGSYGGFMTLMAIGRAPDEFAAAVQWFGIINWRTMYRDQDELLKAYQRGLLGTPESDPKVYDAASPLTYIRNAKAPLLTIQGENDIRVPRGQAQEVNDILKAKGNVVETVFYPAEGHGFQKRENQLDSLKRTVAWFDKYLKPAAK